MCQMSAVVEHDGKVELVKENVTRLDVLTKGIRISTLFEGVTELTDMTIHHIDFLAGKVFLKKGLET
jgi:predicted RNA-binding protein